MEYVDLHIHSFKSDGTWKPSEIEKEAKRLGMKAFAISDHDTVAGVLECEKCVPAIEMGTTFDNKDLHLLGYFIDVGDARLLREIDKQKINRERRVYDTLEAAEKHDIFIT
ncbi:MAG: PHP domain-containing protein, partial [Candidatus Aenigmatarchaeota archaeon]